MLHCVPLLPLLWTTHLLLLHWQGCLLTVVSILRKCIYALDSHSVCSCTSSCFGLILDQESCHGCPTRSVIMVSPSRPTYLLLIMVEISVTNIIRAQANNHPGTVDPAAALTVIQVLNRILISPLESPQNQTKACHTLSSYLFPTDTKSS